MESLFGVGPDDDEAPIPNTKLPTGGGKPKAGKAGRAEWDEETVAELVCGAMGIPAVVGSLQDGYDRPWWVKEAPDVRPISRPLTRILNRMDPAMIKAVQPYTDGLFLLAGCSIVIGPALREEMIHREAVKYGLYEQAARAAASGAGSNGSRPAYSPDTNADAMASGGSNGAAPDPGLFPPRTRLDRVNLRGTDGGLLDNPPRTG